VKSEKLRVKSFGFFFISKMKTESVVVRKSYDFALRIVKLYKFLVEEQKEYVLSKQILRSGTSVGANIEEAEGGQSKKDFIAKITIAYKEARETNYWIRILRDSVFIDTKQAESLLADCVELQKILASIKITSEQHLHAK
jgi:four helix bundle protein